MASNTVGAVGNETLYLIVTGGGEARRIPAFLPTLVASFRRVIMVPTLAAKPIVSVRELAAVPFHQGPAWSRGTSSR